MTIDQNIYEIFQDLGVDPSTRGYSYLAESVKRTYEDPAFGQNITTAVYPAIAEKFNTTPSAAERCMRHAIHSIFNDPYIADVSQKYFGNVIRSHKGTPTNGQFINCVSNYIRMYCNVD